MKTVLKAFVGGTDGQDLIEYALLASTIAVALLAAMSLVQGALSSEFSTIAASVTTAS